MIIAKDLKLHFENIVDSKYKFDVRDWRNQEFVRKNMIDSSEITLEQHTSYLEMLRTSASQKVYIALLDDEPIAVMTFRIYNDDNKIVSGSYLIKEEYLGKGFGAVLGYVRMEYIFNKMPTGRMSTLVMASNKKNLQLQKDFGCTITKEEDIIRANGKEDKLITLEMTHEEWLSKKIKIERVISRLILLENISFILED